MKIQFVAREDGEIIERGNVYDVISIENGWYRIQAAWEDDSSLYHPEHFDVIDASEPPPVLDGEGAVNTPFAPSSHF